MTGRRRWAVLLPVFVAVMALILLSASIGRLELSQGQVLPRWEDAETVFETPAELPFAPFLGYLYVAVYYLTLVLLPLSILYVIVSPDARKWVLRSLGLLLWLVALVVLIRANPRLFEELSGKTGKPPPVFDYSLREVQFSGSLPAWAVWGATILLALLLASGLVAAAWYVWRRTHPPESPLERLAREAEQALGALQAGADLRDTVQRCYVEMSRVVREAKGLARGEAMTPREFERSLGEAGLPQDRVRQLTRLFEDVRYGAKAAGVREEQQAVDCLGAIVEACRSGL
jgi:hypothetical protein